jgi:hypothetical protein
LACPSTFTLRPPGTTNVGPQASGLLFLSTNPGTGHTTARRRRPGTRPEPEHFAGRQLCVGFPKRSGCPHRPEFSPAFVAAPYGRHPIRETASTHSGRGCTFHGRALQHEQFWVHGPGGGRVSDRVVANPVGLLEITARVQAWQHPPCLHLPGRDTFQAPPCLAPGERGGCAARTVPRRQDPLPSFPVPLSPFAALPLRGQPGPTTHFDSALLCRVTVLRRVRVTSLCSSGPFTPCGSGRIGPRGPGQDPGFGSGSRTQCSRRECNARTPPVNQPSLPSSEGLAPAAMRYTGPAGSGPCLQCKVEESPSHPCVGLLRRTRAGRTGWGTTAQ